MIAIVAAGAIAYALWGPQRPQSTAAAGPQGDGSPTFTIRRQTLTSQTLVDGTLGYAGSYAVVNNLSGGYFTELPQPGAGQIVQQGEALYSVGRQPVVLLAGAIPAWRTLGPGASGADVAQLNADLVALGLLTPAAAKSLTFGPETAAAVKKLQARLGSDPTGVLNIGDAVFLPAPLRIVAVTPNLGQPAVAGSAIMAATSTRRVVRSQLTPSAHAQVHDGEPVIITLDPGSPGAHRTQGTITKIDTVATLSQAGGSPTFGIEVTPTDPGAVGTLDQVPVTVSITNATVADALVVPVTALLAVASRDYVVEVVDADGAHRLVPVQLGLFDDDDGLVQVTGAGLAEGQRVVVPQL